MPHKSYQNNTSIFTFLLSPVETDQTRVIGKCPIMLLPGSDGHLWGRTPLMNDQYRRAYFYLVIVPSPPCFPGPTLHPRRSDGERQRLGTAALEVCHAGLTPNGGGLDQAAAQAPWVPIVFVIKSDQKLPRCFSNWIQQTVFNF